MATLTEVVLYERLEFLVIALVEPAATNEEGSKDDVVVDAHSYDKCEHTVIEPTNTHAMKKTLSHRR